MKSEWKVTSNHIDGRTIYGVYRIIDTAEVDHSGNREMHGEYMGSKNDALSIAKRLNAEAEGR
jgi:hypothetical protein